VVEIRTDGARALQTRAELAPGARVRDDVPPPVALLGLGLSGWAGQACARVATAPVGTVEK